MKLNKVLNKLNISQYRLAKLSGVPYTTINDICSGKSSLLKCSAETLYRISSALHIQMENFISDEMAQKAIEASYEVGLPEYLQHDLDAYKEGLRTHSSLLDCLWGELYGSINMAQISDGAITPEHADYLRNKYLWR